MNDIQPHSTVDSQNDGKVFGYIRVSTKEQNEERQVIALENFGISKENTYTEKYPQEKQLLLSGLPIRHSPNGLRRQAKRKTEEVKITKSEKDGLIELLCTAGWNLYTNDCNIGQVADHLIANGVTIMPEWISVEERLPEHKQKVLCFCQAGIWDILSWDYTEWAWIKDSKHAYMQSFVTHWMPLPEPPEVTP